MKNLIFYFFLLVVPFIQAGCGSDDTLFPCAGVQCGEFGDCEDGICICQNGVSLDASGKCTIQDRDKFIGVYATTSTVCGTGSFPQGTVLDCSKSSSLNEMRIKFGSSVEIFSILGIANGNDISIASQESGLYEYSGTGVLSSNGALLSLELLRKEEGEECIIEIWATK